MIPRHVITIVLLGITAMCAALFFGLLLPPREAASCAAETMNGVLVTCWQIHLLPTLVKIAASAVLLVPMVKLVQAMMGFTSFAELKNQHRSVDGNDSPTILLAAVFIALALLMYKLPYTAFWNFFIYLLWKGGFAMILSVIFSFLGLRYMVGLRSLERVNELMKEPGNNAVALIMGGCIVAAVFFV